MAIRPRHVATAWTVLALGVATIPACTSVQWLDGSGHPRVLGLATAEAQPGSPGVTRIVAPGASVRLIPGLGGYALGWRETLLFQVDSTNGHRRTVAFADRVHGVRLDPLCIVLGTDHRFGIFAPSAGESILQDIRYSGSGRMRGWISTKENR